MMLFETKLTKIACKNREICNIVKFVKLQNKRLRVYNTKK